MNDMIRSEKYIRLDSLGLGPYVMKKLRVCAKCGQVVRGRLFFCPGCRSRMPAMTLFDFYKKMHFYCPGCEIALAPDARYCPHCGRKVTPDAD